MIGPTDALSQTCPAAYAAEKQRLADLVDWDKTAYSIAKGPFVQDVLAARR